MDHGVGELVREDKWSTIYIYIFQLSVLEYIIYIYILEYSYSNGNLI